MVQGLSSVLEAAAASSVCGADTAFAGAFPTVVHTEFWDELGVLHSASSTPVLMGKY